MPDGLRFRRALSVVDEMACTGGEGCQYCPMHSTFFVEEMQSTFSAWKEW
jgi:hypothetical protein